MNTQASYKLLNDLTKYVDEHFLENPKYTKNDFQKHLAIKIMDKILKVCVDIDFLIKRKAYKLMHSYCIDKVKIEDRYRFNIIDVLPKNIIHLTNIEAQIIMKTNKEFKRNSYQTVRDIVYDCKKLSLYIKRLSDNHLLELIKNLINELSSNDVFSDVQHVNFIDNLNFLNKLVKT